MDNNHYENSKNNLQFINNRRDIVSTVSNDYRPYETLKHDTDQIPTYDVLQRNVNYFTLEREKKQKCGCKKRYIAIIILGILLLLAIAATIVIFVEFNNQQIVGEDCGTLQERCPVDNGYIYYPDVCLCIKYINTALSHDNATVTCRENGGELVRVDSPIVQQRLEAKLETITFGEVWIQGELDSSGVWRFVDQTEMTYFNWNTADGQPSGRPDEIYVLIRKSQNYLWHDISPGGRLRAVCQML